MTFLELLYGAEVLAQNGNPGISGLDYDSRRIKPGDAFIAMQGESSDGNKFIDQAISAGAVAIVTDSATEKPRPNVAWAQVPHGRRALARLSANFYKKPAERLAITGITGTNGKSTTAFLLESILSAAGRKSALVGTIEYHVAGKILPAPHTTPEALELNRMLADALGQGATEAVMEVSSHALEQQRVYGIPFNVAVFTNLTRDHLDYHHTMENYFSAKKLLFDGSLGELPECSVINVDDAAGRELVLETRKRGQRVVTYGLNEPADISASEVHHSLDGMSFRLDTTAGSLNLTSPLVGRPHIYNIMAAVATGLELGYSLDVIARAIRTSNGAPGRFERVPHSGKFAVVVDYAHTDDALLNVLRTARNVAEGRIITVFGCGGDRDTSKRAPMGEAAGSLSDVVILTSDNPRTEDPEKILADVEIGLLSTSKPYEKIADRRKAIFRAIEEARNGDVVIIAGKGHEDYQIIGKDISHFDDKEIAMEALAQIHNGSSVHGGKD